MVPDLEIANFIRTFIHKKIAWNMTALSHYIDAFENLKTDKAHGGSAPHKPILLLSLLQLMHDGFYSSSDLKVSPVLIDAFEKNWKERVVTTHACNIALPFYHLSSSTFWTLVANKGYEKMLEVKLAMRSLKNLQVALSHARVDDALYELMRDKEANLVLKDVLIRKYFPH